MVFVSHPWMYYNASAIERVVQAQIMPKIHLQVIAGILEGEKSERIYCFT